jgi:hypothetical protein
VLETPAEPELLALAPYFKVRSSTGQPLSKNASPSPAKIAGLTGFPLLARDSLLFLAENIVEQHLK